MSVRAKFKLTRVEITQAAQRDYHVKDREYYRLLEQRTFVFQPVTAGDADSENRRFWEATPNGELKLGIIKPELWPMFEVGREYYLDCTPAD